MPHEVMRLSAQEINFIAYSMKIFIDEQNKAMKQK